MQSLIDDKTWILEDLSKAELAELEIEIEGTLIFTDALEIQTSLLLTAPHLYLLQPFSVKDGTFDIRYQNGIISQLNFLFESKIEDGYIVLNSVSAVQAPSHRQISIKMLPRVEFQVPISDLLRAYAQAFPDRDRIEERAAFLAKTTDQEKLDYLRQHIFLPITNNTAKEIIGETLYRLHMTRTQPNFQFYNAKVGRHSFDAVHIELPAVRHPNILISEVKYAKEGKPILKFITLENKQWKQLSLPYVKNKLETMLLHTSETQTLAQSIQAHPKAQVELRLAVFNPHEFKLVVYQVGTLERSALD